MTRIESLKKRLSRIENILKGGPGSGPRFGGGGSAQQKIKPKTEGNRTAAVVRTEIENIRAEADKKRNAAGAWPKRLKQKHDNLVREYVQAAQRRVGDDRFGLSKKQRN